MQNKANWPGGRACRGRTVESNRAKQSQFRPEHRRRVGATHASPTNRQGPEAAAGDKRAKQSQFRPDGQERACPPRPSVRNKANFSRRGGTCAKQSQTWEDWGIWAKAATVWTGFAGGRNLRNKASLRRRPRPVPSSGPRIWASSVDRNRPICYKIQLAPAWAGKKSRTREGLLAFCSVQPSLKAQGCPLRETPTLREAFIRRTATSRHKLDFLDEVAALRRARSGSRKGPSGQGDKNGNSAIEATEFLVVAEIEVPLLTGGQVCVEGLLA